MFKIFQKCFLILVLLLPLSLFVLSPSPASAVDADESAQCLCGAGDNPKDLGCQTTRRACQEACDDELGQSGATITYNESCSGEVSDGDSAKIEPPAAPSADVSSRAAATLTLTNPLAGAQDFRVVIGRVIKALMTLAGALALLAFIWGGIQMMTSAGNPSKHDAGKKTLIWATLGLVVIFTAYALVNTVITALTSGSV